MFKRLRWNVRFHNEIKYTREIFHKLTKSMVNGERNRNWHILFDFIRGKQNKKKIFAHEMMWRFFSDAENDIHIFFSVFSTSSPTSGRASTLWREGREGGRDRACITCERSIFGKLTTSEQLEANDLNTNKNNKRIDVQHAAVAETTMAVRAERWMNKKKYRISIGLNELCNKSVGKKISR